MPRRTLPQPDFPSEIMKPIEIKPIMLPPLIGSGDYETALENYKNQKRDQRTYIAIRRTEKTLLLAKYYGLQPDSPDFWQQMYMRTTEDCIDGFKVVEKKPTGRKTLWNDSLLYRLWYTVEGIRKEKRHSVSSACRTLLNKTQWKEMLQAQKNESQRTKQRPQKILADRYAQAEKSSLVTFSKKVDEALRQQGKDYDVYAELYKALLA